MEIDFEVGNPPASGDPEKRVVSVIMIEDLPAACVDLQKKIQDYTRVHRTVEISSLQSAIISRAPSWVYSWIP